jgi:hypothetical protein
MKGLGLGIVLGILAIFVIGIIGVLINNIQNTGITGDSIQPLEQINNIQNPEITGDSTKPLEQVIIDDEQLIGENMRSIQTFELYKQAQVSIDIDSEGLVDYALLSETEAEHYTKGESYRAYSDRENVLSYQMLYNLDEGKYSVVVTNNNEPVNIHLIVKAS